MLETMKALVREKDICVMATVSGNKPHCSLMAYVSDEEGLEIYMLTDKLTKKYSNMTENPFVSIMIDTRDEDAGPQRLRSKALTIEGEFEEIHDKVKRDRVRTSLLERHPHLNVLAMEPDAIVFAVKVLSLLLLDGVQQSYFERIR